MRTRSMVPLAALLLAGVPASAAEPVEGGWLAWYGCWQAVGEDAPEGQLLCVLPGDDASSARLVTLVDGAATGETLVRADGVERPVAEGGCTGSERAFFSHDGRRIFTRATLDCAGVARVSTGVLALVSEIEWVDARGMSVDGQEAARAVRYRAVASSDVPQAMAAALPRQQSLALESARLVASAPLDLDDVIEASHVLAAPAVEALLAARQSGFGLDARKLVLLRDAGVSASTIDVMVALSYPQRFAVREPRAQRDREVPEEWERSRRTWNQDCYDPYWTNRRYRDECYDNRYGYGDRYGYNRYDRSRRYSYSPWGYDPWGWNYGNQPVVITRPGDVEEPDEGDVVKGRGYTRTGTPRGTATPRGDSASPARSGDSSRGSATSSDSGRSSTTERSSDKGGSSDNGRTDTGRTAKPRGGGS